MFGQSRVVPREGIRPVSSHVAQNVTHTHTDRTAKKSAAFSAPLSRFNISYTCAGFICI